MSHIRKFVTLLVVAVSVAGPSAWAEHVPVQGRHGGLAIAPLRGHEPLPQATTAQPGTPIHVADSDCTLGFQLLARGRVYFVTAGHCVLNRGVVGESVLGERSWTEATGPVATLENGKALGHVVYAINDGTHDVGLVIVTRGQQTSARLLGWGGPYSLYSQRGIPTGTELRTYGQGIATKNLLPARSLQTLSDQSDTDAAYGWGLASPGDSGSPVMTADGRALGLLVSLTDNTTGPVLITRLPEALRWIDGRRRIPLVLATAPNRHE